MAINDSPRGSLSILDCPSLMDSVRRVGLLEADDSNLSGHEATARRIPPMKSA